MKVVTLKNGAEEVEPFVRATMMSLQNLMREKPIAFYELVQLCKDDNHMLFGDIGKILEKFSLVENSVVHDSVRNIVLSAVEGDGFDMRLISPVTA